MSVREAYSSLVAPSTSALGRTIGLMARALLSSSPSHRADLLTSIITIKDCMSTSQVTSTKASGSAVSVRSRARVGSKMALIIVATSSMAPYVDLLVMLLFDYAFTLF